MAAVSWRSAVGARPTGCELMAPSASQKLQHLCRESLQSVPIIHVNEYSDDEAACYERLRVVQLKPTHCKLLRMIASMAEVLEKANVTFMMIDGTLLGAFRHHGFIPWDDDAECALSYFLFFLVISVGLLDYFYIFVLNNDFLLNYK